MMMDFGYTPGAVPRPKPKRHGNAGRPKPQTTIAARARAEDGSLPADSKHLRSDAWLPLAGSVPVGLEHRKGCAWPVTEKAPHLFCNLDVEPGARLHYCPTHLKRYHSPREALK